MFELNLFELWKAQCMKIETIIDVVSFFSGVVVGFPIAMRFGDYLKELFK